MSRISPEELLSAIKEAPKSARLAIKALSQDLVDAATERDALRSSLSAAEKELADLRLAFGTMLTDHANMADAKRRAEDETNLLRAEVASLKAPADRFDARDEANDLLSARWKGVEPTHDEIESALRTAYQRGAQDQGAEIERLRSDYERQLADMTTTLEQANALYDEAQAEIERLRSGLAEERERRADDGALLSTVGDDYAKSLAEIERLRGALRTARRWALSEVTTPIPQWAVEQIVDAIRETAVPRLPPLSPAPIPSPVDSLTGEALDAAAIDRICFAICNVIDRSEVWQQARREPETFRQAVRMALRQKQPVEAEQPKPRVPVTVETCPLCAGRKGEPSERLCDGHRENCPRCLGWRGAHAVLCDTKNPPPAAPMKEQPKPVVMTWTCARCNYMNAGVVCTHCGKPRERRAAENAPPLQRLDPPLAEQPKPAAECEACGGGKGRAGNDLDGEPLWVECETCNGTGKKRGEAGQKGGE